MFIGNLGNYQIILLTSVVSVDMETKRIFNRLFPGDNRLRTTSNLIADNNKVYGRGREGIWNWLHDQIFLLSKGRVVEGCE